MKGEQGILSPSGREMERGRKEGEILIPSPLGERG